MHYTPQVRSAALHCIGQMSMDFPGGKQDSAGKKQKSYQNLFHAMAVPALVASLEPEGINAQCPRVRAQAALVVCHFCDPSSCAHKSVQPYAAGLLGALFKCLQSGTKILQEPTLTIHYTLY
jgi:hypothetical protein